MAPSAFYSNTNVHLMDINVFASLMKFHHCLFKILRKNQNVVDKELQRAILATSPYFSIINVHLVDINVFAKFAISLPFQDKSKRLGWTNRWTDVKQYTKHSPHPQTQFAGGYNKNWLPVSKDFPSHDQNIHAFGSITFAFTKCLFFSS